MSTIQELIDSGEVVLGKTKVNFRYNSSPMWVIPHWLINGDYICQLSTETEKTIRYHKDDGATLYKEPVEMENRWLWSDDDGYVKCLTRSAGRYKTKIEGSKTQFPKEKK